MKRIKEWSTRYFVADIIGTISTLIGAGLVFSFTKNGILAAYAGVIGENIGFYGWLAAKDFRKKRKAYEKMGKEFSLDEISAVARNLFIEFGFSEITDTFFVRPFCLFWFSHWTTNYSLGILIGKMVADIFFYIPAIVAYEMRKKYSEY